MPSLRPGTFVRDATKPDRIEFGELGWPKPKVEELAVTTVRLRPDQWQWLKKAAFERALQGRSKPDASAIMRELVDGAMTRKG